MSCTCEGSGPKDGSPVGLRPSVSPVIGQGSPQMRMGVPLQTTLAPHELSTPTTGGLIQPGGTVAWEDDPFASPGGVLTADNAHELLSLSTGDPPAGPSIGTSTQGGSGEHGHDCVCCCHKLYFARGNILRRGGRVFITAPFFGPNPLNPPHAMQTNFAIATALCAVGTPGKLDCKCTLEWWEWDTHSAARPAGSGWPSFTWRELMNPPIDADAAARKAIFDQVTGLIRCPAVPAQRVAELNDSVQSDASRNFFRLLSIRVRVNGCQLGGCNDPITPCKNRCEGRVIIVHARSGNSARMLIVAIGFDNLVGGTHVWTQSW